MARAIELAVERLGRGSPILFVHGDTSEGQALAAVARLREMTPPIGPSSRLTPSRGRSPPPTDPSRPNRVIG